jgi:predicted nucleotidyltransferase
MRSRDDILKQLHQHLRVLAQKYHVQRIGVFGSVSRGDQTEGSDIDILVEFSRPVGFFCSLNWKNI